MLALPLSRERLKLDDLRRTLAAYRMVFGQHRQEDLLNYLKARLSAEQLKALLSERIELSPSSWIGVRKHVVADCGRNLTNKTENAVPVFDRPKMRSLLS